MTDSAHLPLRDRVALEVFLELVRQSKGDFEDLRNYEGMAEVAFMFADAFTAAREKKETLEKDEGVPISLCCGSRVCVARSTQAIICLKCGKTCNTAYHQG